jgi:hypothetical protein
LGCIQQNPQVIALKVYLEPWRPATRHVPADAVGCTVGCNGATEAARSEEQDGSDAQYAHSILALE